MLHKIRNPYIKEITYNLDKNSSKVKDVDIILFQYKHTNLKWLCATDNYKDYNAYRKIKKDVSRDTLNKNNDLPFNKLWYIAND